MTDAVLEGGNVGLALSALLVALVILREVVVPKLKRNGNNNPHRPPLYCQAGRYESRISSLETTCRANTLNVDRLERKIDHTIETTSTIASDVSAIREAIEWMRSNGGKRRSDP